MSLSPAIEIASGVLLLIGSVFALSGGAGLLRFPDFYTRAHAVSLTDSVGAGFILLGLLLRSPEWGVGVRLVLILLFLLLTGPTAAHLLARAARRDRLPAWFEGEQRR